MLSRTTAIVVASLHCFGCSNEESVDPKTHRAVFGDENTCYDDYEGGTESAGECSSNDDCMVACGKCGKPVSIPMCTPNWWSSECPPYFQQTPGIFCGCLNRKCVWVMPVENASPCQTQGDCGDAAQCMSNGALAGYCVPLCTDDEWTQYFLQDEMCRLGDPAMDDTYCEPATGTCESLP